MKKVLVFAERMLPSTQTFIPLQVNELQRYRPQYVGLIPADRNLALPHPPVMLTQDRGSLSRIRRELYRWTGVAPSFHARLREKGADLIHAHFAEGGPAALSLSRHLRLPLILHLRGGAEMLPDQELRRHLFQWPFLAHRKRLWQRASLFLCSSNFIREKAVKAGFPAEKTRVQYTGMDVEGFTITETSDHKDPNMVLYVGRLVPYKGCDYLLRAMQQVQQRRPEAHLVIIGDGTFRAQLESLARELGVRCQFLGEKPQKEIRTWYERARVFCGPSVTLEDGMSEAFGNVFSEAQAMGVPVVSFHHGGIPETMQDGITGLLAQERDVPMLAEHLLRYLEDDAFWFRSRQEGMRWVREAFDVRRQTARLEELYDGVVASFQPSRFQQKAQL
jgi:colanic acid/amylovoran biosynthesis glycosyltransferase